MRKGSHLPRYICKKCGKEQSRKGTAFYCRYCKEGRLKLIRFGWDGIIRQFQILEAKEK